MRVESRQHFYNMDIVRYVLCSCVYLSHYFFLNGKDSIFPIETFNVGFFALSGFLAYRTYNKAKTAKQYLKRRFCKLMTPYYIVIIGFAIFLARVSSLGLAEYFTSFWFWKYLFYNILTLNFMCPQLPGVFDTYEFMESAVNPTLWTMKVELVLFMTLPLFMKLSKKTKHVNALLLTIIIVSLAYRTGMTYAYYATGNRMYDMLGRQFLGEFCFYYLGLYTYLNLQKVLRLKWYIFSGIIAVILIKYFVYNFVSSSSLIITSATLWFSVAGGNWGKYVKVKHNISYMIYLCHCPLLQLGIYFHLNNYINDSLYFVVITFIIILVSIFLYRLNDKITKLEKLQCLYR